jgi:putative tricarboxylic transport membrane protein
LQRAAYLLPGALTCAGAVMLWQSLTAMDYFLAARFAPGPGFLPFWVSLGVVIVGAVLTARALLFPNIEAKNADWPDALGKRRIAYLLGGFGVFLLAINILGFIVASILFLGCASYLLGMRSMRVLIPVSLAVGAMFHVIFDNLLRISLPEGMLGLSGERLSSWIF